VGGRVPVRLSAWLTRLGDHLAFDPNLPSVRDGHLQLIRSHHPLFVALDLFPQRPVRDRQGPGRILQRLEKNPDASTKTCVPAGSLMGPLLATSSAMALLSR
jgi:hypothetical protein